MNQRGLLVGGVVHRQPLLQRDGGNTRHSRRLQRVGGGEVFRGGVLPLDGLLLHHLRLLAENTVSVSIYKKVKKKLLFVTADFFFNLSFYSHLKKLGFVSKQ